MKYFFILCFLFFGISFKSHSAEPNFDFLCHQLLQKQPVLSDGSAYFTSEFQKSFSLEKLKTTFSYLYQNVGRCTSYQATPVGKRKYSVVLSGDKKIDVLFSVSLEENSNLIDGLFIEGAVPQIQNWQDLVSTLTELDSEGKVSATLMTEDNSVQLNYNESEALAVGSTFKLYILGALEQSIFRGEHEWNEILPLKEEWKSLPSGVMQDWLAGKKITLYEYAEKMISLSDNTATDHLFHLLGRNHIEAMLNPMGNLHEVFYLPFLSTLEMFKLKWAINPLETQSYIQQDIAGRNTILNTIAQIPKETYGTNDVNTSQPTHIDKIEWFATTQENCQAMFWLAHRNNTQVNSILAKNVPILKDISSNESHWSYVGYKGGSEPGVLSMTYLLESKKGKRACLSMSWNNPKQNVSLNVFVDIIRKTLKLAEEKIP